MSVISHLTVDDWSEKAIDEFYMFPHHVQKTRNVMYEHHDLFTVSGGVLEPAPELVTSFSDDPQFKDRELRVIASLRDGRHLARTFNNPSLEVTFIILDERRIGSIFYQFEWDCRIRSLYSTSGRYWEYKPHFYCKVSSDGLFAIIVGPDEHGKETYIPTVKLLSLRSWTLKTLQLTDWDNGLPIWPVNMEFDPRLECCNLVTMICTADNTVFPFEQSEYDGILLRYNVEEEQSMFSDGSVSSAFLEYIKDGHQFLVLQNSTGSNDDDQIMLLYNSDTLGVILRIDLNRIKFISRWKWACNHIIPVYSACYRYLSLGFWSMNSAGEPDTDVITIQLPYIGDTLLSLKHICRRVIVCTFQSQSIHDLPLPKRLLHYLNGELIEE